MTATTFTREDLHLAGAKAKQELDSFFLEDKIRRYGRADRLEGDGLLAYNSLLDCFSLYFLVRDKSSGEGGLFKNSDGRAFASVYSLNIGAQYGLSLVSDEREKEPVMSIEMDRNIFWGSHHIDLSGSTTNQCRSFISDLSSSLNNGYNQPLENIISDFYSYMIAETKKASENPRFREFHKIIFKNPVKYKGMVFNGFSGGVEVGKRQERQLDWSMMEGYDSVKKGFQDYQIMITHFDEAFRYWNDIANLLPNLILNGPSGTGKSFSARIFGSTLQSMGIPYFEINFGHIADSYVNGATKKLASFFDKAEEPIRKGISRFSAIYVDEVDAFAQKGTPTSSSEDEKVRNILKARLGEGNQLPGLIFIGSTNYAEFFPPEVLRRCEIIQYDLPTQDMQVRLFEHFFKKNRGSAGDICGSVDFKEVTKEAVNPNTDPSERYSAGHISNIVKKAVRKRIADCFRNNTPIKPIDTQYLVNEVVEYSKSRDFRTSGARRR